MLFCDPQICLVFMRDPQNNSNPSVTFSSFLKTSTAGRLPLCFSNNAQGPHFSQHAHNTFRRRRGNPCVVNKLRNLENRVLEEKVERSDCILRVSCFSDLRLFCLVEIENASPRHEG